MQDKKYRFFNLCLPAGFLKININKVNYIYLALLTIHRP